MSNTGFDRSKIKGAKLSANKEAQKEASKLTKRSGYLGYHEINEGRNVFRIMPPHPDDTIGAAYLPVRTTQLKCEVKKRDDEGNETGQTEIKSKKIFSAKLHGVESGMTNDPIELYIEYVYKKAKDEIEDEKERKKFLRPITGWRGRDGWHWGINMRTSYLAYALDSNEELKKLELYETMVADMNKISISEEEDEPIDVDPFSDPDEGYPLVITKGKKDKGGWEYLITKDMPSRKLREGYPEFFERTRITDEQLIKLCDQKPLSSLVGHNVYSRRDWDFALDGLRRFDEDNGNPEKSYQYYGIFENEEFLSQLQELESLVPEYQNNSDEEESTDSTDSNSQDETEEDEDNAPVSTTQMRMELRKAVKTMFGAEYTKQVPTNPNELAKVYSKWVESDGEDLSFVDVDESEGDEPEKSETQSEPISQKVSELRKRREAAAKK